MPDEIRGLPPEVLTPETRLYVNGEREVFFGDAAARRLASCSDAGYLTDEGVVRVDRERWMAAQAYERDTWMSDAVSAADDRNQEHRGHFQGYEAIRGMSLSSPLELGCGPFTNMRLILPLLTDVKEVVLLDPLIDEYLTHPHCAYPDRRLGGVPVTTVASPIEDFVPDRAFDLIVMVNVLEHCFDCAKVFDVITSALAPRGVLVFADCVFRPDEVQRVVENQYDCGHPIRVTETFVDAFLDGFESLFASRIEGLHGQRHRIDRYFIGRAVGRGASTEPTDEGGAACPVR